MAPAPLTSGRGIPSPPADSFRPSSAYLKPMNRAMPKRAAAPEVDAVEPDTLATDALEPDVQGTDATRSRMGTRSPGSRPYEPPHGDSHQEHGQHCRQAGRPKTLPRQFVNRPHGTSIRSDRSPIADWTRLRHALRVLLGRRCSATRQLSLRCNPRRSRHCPYIYGFYETVPPPRQRLNIARLRQNRTVPHAAG